VWDGVSSHSRAHSLTRALLTERRHCSVGRVDVRVLLHATHRLALGLVFAGAQEVEKLAEHAENELRAKRDEIVATRR
jgi:HPt (histidine-containing phosphotransfer) domain-containing protein